MSKEPGDKNVDRRLGRMAIFRGLAGDTAIDATTKDGVVEAGPDDHDRGPQANDSDSDAGPPRAAATDSDNPPQSATDSDKGRSHPRDSETD
jgi:hypothetical protein